MEPSVNDRLMSGRVVGETEDADRARRGGSGGT